MDRRTERLFALCRAAAARTRLVVTGHDHADADAALSCVLMRELLARAGIPAQIVLTRTGTQARRVLARFGIEADALSGEIRATDALVLCDHHRPEHAGEVVACVDHHPTDFPPDYPYTQIEAAGACAVMVLRLFEAAGYEPGKRCTEMAPKSSTPVPSAFSVRTICRPSVRGSPVSPPVDRYTACQTPT